MKRQNQPEMPQTPANGEVAKSIEKKKRKGLALKIAGGLAAAAAALTIFTHSEYHTPHSLNEIGFTPTPTVNEGSTKQMIDLNDTLINPGADILIAGGIGLGAYELARRRSKRFEMGHKFTHDESRINQRLLNVVAVGSVAAALGLGNAVSANSGEAIHDAAAMFGANESTTAVITGNPGALGDHMAISGKHTPVNSEPADNYEATAQAIREAGGMPLPFIVELGLVENPKKKDNPPSSQIIGIPRAVIAKSMGVELPPVENCGDMEIIVNDQLGVPTNDVAKVNGRNLHVAKTVPMKPGLNRAIAIGAEEDVDKCLYPDSKMIVAAGLDVSQANDLLAKLNGEMDTQYNARTFGDLALANKEFFDGNIKPAEMNLIMQILLLSAAAGTLAQQIRLNNRRKKTALQLRNGTKKLQLDAMDFVADQRDLAIATLPAVGLYTGLVWMINASQAGMSQPVEAGEVGGALLAGSLITAGGSLFNAWKTRKSVQPFTELRGGA